MIVLSTKEQKVVTTESQPASDRSAFARLQEVPGQDLRWIQPDAWKQCYELRAGESLLATMRSEGFWKTSFIVESAEGTWRLDRSGFWTTKVQAIDTTTQAEVVSFPWKFLGDGLVSLNNNPLRWHSTSFWSSEWAFTDETGTDIIGFKIKGFWRSGAAISLRSGSEGMPLPLLLALGWYFHILHTWDLVIVMAIFVLVMSTSAALR
jgi:hypothetical protein